MNVLMLGCQNNYQNPSFGLKNPKAAAYRAQTLKEKYIKNGIPYLMPNETWSDKKIFDTVEIFGKILDESLQSKTLNKQLLQKTINNFLPDNVKNKIIVKNLSALDDDLKYEGYVKSQRQNILNCSALSSYSPISDNCFLYLDFKKPYLSIFETLEFKSDVKHELKHCLSAMLQNTIRTDILKNNYTVFSGKNGLFKGVFELFEGNFKKPYMYNKIELTQQALSKWLGLSSIENLHEKFNNILNKIFAEQSNVNALEIKSDSQWEQFFKYLKHHAKDEKEAYLSNKDLRDYFVDNEKPRDIEYKSLLLQEMEIFFAKKERACKKPK